MGSQKSMGSQISIELPVDCPITQNFGENAADYSRFKLIGHNGIDFGCPIGTSVRACDSGIVDKVGNDPEGYGTYIKLKHNWGYSIYAHLSSAYTDKSKNYVYKGDIIAITGNSGYSTGPHLHFEIRPFTEPKTNGYNGAVNPIKFVGFGKDSGLGKDVGFGKPIPGKPTMTNQAIDKTISDYGLAIVLTDSLNIRSAPTLNSEIIGVVPTGFVIGWLDVVKDGNNEWLKVGDGVYCASYFSGQDMVKKLV